MTGKAHHRWRENIEALVMAIVVALLFKYFVLEISKIPSGSMQPTLMGNPELVRHEATGLLVPPRDPSALAAAILRLLADPAWAAGLGRAGRRLVEARFSTQAKVERLEALYRRVAVEN